MEREMKRESEKEGERGKEEKESERDVCYLKGMTGALAPYSYLYKILRQIKLSLVLTPVCVCRKSN
jgi:hypothetical protein